MQRWAIGVLAVMTLSAVARAQSVERGNWELTLAGVGSSNKDFDSHAIGANVGVGYFPLDFLELGLRQTITYVDNADTSSTDASTTLALDIHLPLGDRGRIVPFIGGTLGYYYGDTFSDSFEYGPEAGIKWFVNDTTFLFFRVEYQIFSNDVFGSSESSDKQWVYGVGIGLRF